MAENILSMENITLVYSNGVVANDGVNFSLKQGEIHALMGENGAGKSTLMKILFGIEKPTAGQIVLAGKPVQIADTNQAIGLGIGMVHQHFMLVPSLTVAQNIVLGCEPTCRGKVDFQAAEKATADLASRFKFNIDVKTPVERISVAQKQKVEILKALYRDAKLLILDEPTAVLTPQETQELFEQLVEMRKNGLTIIFISHKLNEVKKICDRMTIMRAGRSMGTYDVQSLTTAQISNLMVGRDVVLKINKAPARPQKVCLAVKELTAWNSQQRQTLDAVSFALRKGEILGIAGVEGSGQKDIVDLVTGLKKLKKNNGKITINGVDAAGLSISARRAKGLAYIPEDRITYGVARNMSIKNNLIASWYNAPQFNGRLLMKMRAVNQNAKAAVGNYGIRCSSAEQPVGLLSGGNMQKVVVARELAGTPEILVAEQPTRGVDVGAIEFIHSKLVEIRDAGCGVLLVSADLNEILELADSIIVLCQGKITAYISDVKNTSESELGYYMLGVNQQPQQEIRRACHEN